MDSEIKKRWINALRSGDYEQGTQFLKDERGRFCCLGVLCDLYNPEGWSSRREKFVFSEGSSENGNYLIPEVIQWAGLDSRNPSTNYRGLNLTLGELNDVWGLTFHQIADVIEEQL